MTKYEPVEPGKQYTTSLARFRASRERLANDLHRPLYHLSPPAGSMNDPNGLCHWQGRYHLFYQFIPEGQRRWHWGHFVSEDLVHWRDLPPAIYPDQEEHCYSGQTVVEKDRVVAMYHGTQWGNCIATASDPLLLNWQGHPDNPVIPIVPVDEDGLPYHVFDPCIWKEADGYYALSGVFGYGERGLDCRNIDHLFRSTDLREWEHLEPLIEDGFHTDPGEDGAVPNFWPIGNGKHMLLFFSHKRAAQYYMGTYDVSTHRFMPDYHGRCNYSVYAAGNLHAPSATIDDVGRYLGIFNIGENRAIEAWRDIMSLPRHFSLDADNALRIEPVPELASLRFDQRTLAAMEIAANDEVVLENVAGQAIEIEAEIDPQDAREVGLRLLRAPDGAEQTTVSFLGGKPWRRNKDAGYLNIDLSASSLRSDVFGRPPEIGPLSLSENEPLRLHIFVDRTVVEVFANGRQCLTARVYPERETSAGVSIYARGRAARLQSLSCWQMCSIWPELKAFEGQ